jgi:hypothetical protein
MVKVKPQLIHARILIEPGTESLERTKSYVISAVKSSCRNIRDGNVVVALYDEDDHLLGMDVTGVPSETLQDTIDGMFDKFEEGSFG